MDVISGLPDDLLLKILSILPTKAAISTSVLSKRWEFLWLSLPKLEYVTSSVFEYRRLRCFLNKTLPLHRAPIKSFCLVTYPFCKPEDVKSWFVVGVSRHLRKLDILCKAILCKINLLPSSLFACKSLVILKLCGYILLDVPRKAYLPSLKTLQLQKVTGVDGQTLQRLLSVCPVLENLSVNSCYGSGNISVIIPSLQRLSIYNIDDAERIEIDSPSLKYLKLSVFNEESYYISVGNMPKLEEAYVDVNVDDIDSLVGSITSVKRLTLCCLNATYSDNLVFNQLEHLKLCDCTASLTNLLARLLKDSPNLRVLDIFHMWAHVSSYMVNWNEPSTVPECFLSTLQTFNWSGYLGRPQDKDIVVYNILKNACRLKTVTISSSERAITNKFQMIKELSNSSRASATCQLIFD